MLTKICALILSVFLAAGVTAATAAPVATIPDCPFPISVKTYRSGNSARIFFVDIFGGPWPIPDRYEILGPSGNGAIRMVSPPHICVSGAHVCTRPNGLIKYGPLSTSLREGETHEKTTKNVTVEHEKHDGLMVTIRTLPSKANHKPVRAVTIYGKNQYILIADAEPNLWRCMLMLHTKLVDAIQDGQRSGNR